MFNERQSAVNVDKVLPTSEVSLSQMAKIPQICSKAALHEQSCLYAVKVNGNRVCSYFNTFLRLFAYFSAVSDLDMGFTKSSAQDCEEK